MTDTVSSSATETITIGTGGYGAAGSVSPTAGVAGSWLASFGATIWTWIRWAALYAWSWCVTAVIHSPKIAASAILGLFVALYFGHVTLPVKSDPVITTQMTGLKAIVDDLTATVASKADIAVLSARIAALEHPTPAAALVTGSITKPSKK